MRMPTRTITLYALLTAIALVLGWLETMIPIAIPGVKLGLGNIVLLYALYMINRRGAAVLMLLKVLLTALLFGGFGWRMVISLGGGVLSLAAMILAQLAFPKRIVLVSVCGAIFHIVGQLAVIVIARMTPWVFIIGYLPILGISAVITGVLSGVVAKYALRALKVIEREQRLPQGQKKG